VRPVEPLQPHFGTLHQTVQSGDREAVGGVRQPVVRHAESRDLWDLAREMGRVTGAAPPRTTPVTATATAANPRVVREPRSRIERARAIPFVVMSACRVMTDGRPRLARNPGKNVASSFRRSARKKNERATNRKVHETETRRAQAGLENFEQARCCNGKRIYYRNIKRARIRVQQ